MERAGGSVTGWLVPQFPLSATTCSMQRDGEKRLERRQGGKKDGINDHGIEAEEKYGSKVSVLPVANCIGVDRCIGGELHRTALLSLSLSLCHSLCQITHSGRSQLCKAHMEGNQSFLTTVPQRSLGAHPPFWGPSGGCSPQQQLACNLARVPLARITQISCSQIPDLQKLGKITNRVAWHC